MSYADKRDMYYSESNYDWVKRFAERRRTWTEKDISIRAENMADIYYHKILKKE